MHINDKVTDEELAVLVSSGDAEAGELLIKRYKDKVRAKAGLYFMLGADREDVVQEGMIGLFKAVRAYDPERGASFSTFAEHCISAQILKAVRAAGRLKHAPLNNAVSLHRPADGGDGQTLADTLAAGFDADPEELAVLAEAERAIGDEKSGLLSALERQVFSALREGKGYRQIAEELGRPPKSVDNAIQRIRNKIRSLFD